MNYNKKTVRDVDVSGKKVLLRCDFNVPQDMATGAITDDKRIVAALPTIRYLLENTRFESGETKNDPELSKALASLADLYVSDAFGSVHRAHASTAGVAEYLPAVSGFLIAQELAVMGSALANPRRPLVAILGGSKVSGKIGVINNLLDIADTVIVGGGMCADHGADFFGGKSIS